MGQSSDVWALVEPLVAKKTKVRAELPASYGEPMLWMAFRCVCTIELAWVSVIEHTRYMIYGGVVKGVARIPFIEHISIC